MEFSNYKESAITALSCAQTAAAEFKHAFCGSEHLLMGLIKCGDGTSRLLQKYGVTEAGAAPYIDTVVGGGRNRLTDSFGYTRSVKRILELALYEAKSFDSELIGTEHILLSVMRERDCMGARIIDSICTSKSAMRRELLNGNADDGQPPEVNAGIEQDISADVSAFFPTEEKPRGAASVSVRGTATPVLDSYSRDITALARQGRLDPVIGRDSEIDRVILTLCRRSKNNPVLIGEPGVGKTAIAEGLASLIANDRVPERLSGCRILSLDIGAMIAGTKYRGEFEERFKAAVDELADDPQTILFIDEIHTIVGAGASEGSVDAANILKPALARGELRVIGATTIDEYRRYIEKDAALERRFSPILVNEPTTEQTLEILKGLIPRYEKHHNARITDEAAEAAVELSVRFMADRRLPDKAIDLIDEAAAYVNLKKCEAVSADSDIAELRRKMESAALKGDYSLAEKLRNDLRDASINGAEGCADTPAVTAADVEFVVSERTGLDASAIKAGLLGLEDRLRETVFGQDAAIADLTAVLKRSSAGLSYAEEPAASVCFIGPAGTGRETLAVRLAECIYNNSVVRLNGNEYADDSAVYRLIGSPIGYRDSEKGGILTEHVKLHPFTVIIVRDCALLSQDASALFGRIASEGVIEDSRGHSVSFRNCVLVFIADTDPIRSLGFEGGTTDRRDIRSNARRALPDCIFRELDSVIEFQAHDRESLVGIAHAELNKLQARVERRGISLAFDSTVEQKIAEMCGGSAYEVRRIVSNLVEGALSTAVLKGEITAGCRAVCTCSNGSFSVERR